LTNIANRRLIRKRVTKEIKNFQNHNGVFSLAIIDIDYFKVINDKYGHNIGDITLKSYAQLLKSFLGEDYSLGRWGGEDF
jgi:diguanylate cyclase (GGDEF)-like protein